MLKGFWKFANWALAPAGARQVHATSADLRWTVVGGVALVVAAGLPHELGRPMPKVWIPLVWPIMPVPAWTAVFCAGIIVVRCLQLVSAFPDCAKRDLQKKIAWWVVAFLLSAVWFVLGRGTVEILRGALPIEPYAGIGLAALLGVSALISRGSFESKNEGGGKKVSLYFGLVAGSSVFCLPLFWLLLTSFKEYEDNTGKSLVWVPKVTVQHAYWDSDQPLVKTNWNGRSVLATVLNHNSNGTLELEVERPFPLRGWRFAAEKGKVVNVQRQGAVVTAPYAGKAIKGFVKRDLVGGEKLVEIIEPSSLTGVTFRTQESHTVKRVGLRWENYSEALEWLPPETEGGLSFLRNSLWLVAMNVLGAILSCSLVAYGFSRVRFPGRSALFGLMIATMMLPGAVTMLPRFLIWRGLGAIDTLIPIWLPAFTASAFNVFLLREFFKTVPLELEDAAKIDGCSPLATYWRVMLPQVKPALTVIGIWTFMGSWNDFMGPLIYISSPEKMPIAYAIQLFSADKGSEFGLMMAFSTMATMPVLIVFLFGQKFFVEGVQLSGLGGK